LMSPNYGAPLNSVGIQIIATTHSTAAYLQRDTGRYVASGAEADATGIVEIFASNIRGV